MENQALGPPADLDALYHAMSDPTRRAVVEQLVAGPAAVSELAGPLPISLPTFLKHLKVLERSGIVRTEKQGRVRTCHLQPERLGPAEDWFASQRRRMERRLDRLADLAEDLERNPQ